MKKMDPSRTYISAILDKRSCIERDEGHCVKDLRILANRGLERMITVDCDVYAMHEQLENAIYVPGFHRGPDEELLRVMEFLLTLDAVEDVRPLVTKFAGILRLFRLYSKERKSDVSEERSVSINEGARLDTEMMDVGEELA